MKKNCIIIVTFLFIFSFIRVSGQKSFGDYKQYVNKVEIFFCITVDSPVDIGKFSRIVSVDKVKGNEVYAYANEKGFNEFLKLGYEFTPLPHPGILAMEPVMRAKVDIKAVNDWDYYPTYEGYLDIMDQFVATYPNLCQLADIGTSIENREIIAVRISDNPGVDEGEPQFLYTSSMHGDELTGYVTMLHLIDYLLQNYGTNPRITEMVNNTDIWINPLANPDGTYAGGNNTVNGAIRFNANGVDINRNFPDPEDGPHPDGNPWQVETLAFMQLAEDNHFVSSANLHGGAEVCNYPWDTWPTLHADNDWWYYVCREYADTVHEYAPSGYMTDLDNGVTNGYAWYEVAGGRQDYMNYFHQCREFCLELSNDKLPPASQMPSFWEWNYRSYLNYIEQCQFGIRGKVTDAQNGQPVMAEIRILNHDTDSSWVYSHLPSGDYFRPVLQGTWDVQVSAFGYFPQVFQDVQVQNRQITALDVQLQSAPILADFTASQTLLDPGETVNFTDLSWGNPVSWQWTLEGGTPGTSSSQNPTGILYETLGTFDVTLTVSDGINTHTVTKEGYITVNTQYIMQNSTVMTCAGQFFDTGGPDGNYGDNEDITMTFQPGIPGAKVKCEFTSFNVEDDWNCEYDWLKIYNGPNTSSPLLGTWCGTDSPGTILATNTQGALSFRFSSDNSVTKAGWSANISCYGNLPPVAEFTANPTVINQGEEVQFTDGSQNSPMSWSWTFEGGTPAASGEMNPAVIYSEAGTYDVTLTVTNMYGNDTEVKENFIQVLLVGLEDFEAGRFMVYPQPAGERINIKSEIDLTGLEIYTSMGEKVFSADLSGKDATVDVSNMAPGIYLLRLKSAGGAMTGKLIR